MIEIIAWKVIKWKQLWRTIWYPTVNIKYSWNLASWVYKINIIYKWKLLHWAWTFRKDIDLFEWYMFDFDKEIYGSRVDIIIMNKIRENKKVASLEEVKHLIDNDIKVIKNIKNNVLSFWTFDKLHPGHEYYLKNAKKYSDHLVTIVATDNNVKNIKWNYPINNSKTRIENLKKLNIVDEIVLWDEENHLKWIDIYKPSVICLWYDQTSFSSKLKEYIDKNNLNIEIIRISPYKEKIYKSSLI